MKRKAGFTLAEVLITIGIIGTIAAITLPGLTLNITKQQTGPALAKAINTLESANYLAIQQGSVRTMDQLLAAGSKTAYFDSVLNPLLQWRKQTLTKKYYSYDLKSVYNTGAGNTYTTKDGITFLHAAEGPSSLAESRRKSLGLGYSGSYYTVYIDVNGNAKGPNALGRDLFCVWVDTKGTVIPYGGNAWNAYTGNGVKWTGNGCGNNKVHPTDALSCAGSVADNGFKVIY